MRICQIVPSLEVRHGGPSQSVRALANHLAQAGDTVELLATQEPGDTAAPTAGDRATIRLFPRVFPRAISRSPELRDHLLHSAFDCVHHHSLWLRPLAYAAEAARRHERPLVISPRGMMTAWAWNHRRNRKRVAEWLVHPGAFATTSGWHATSAEEADDIRRLGFRQPVCVAPNGVVPPTDAALAAAREAWEKICPAVRSRPVALFYSRLHRKKRVRELIDLWLSAPRGDWLLLVAGTAEDYTAETLAAEVAARGATDRVAVHDGAGRPAPYAVAALFLLPSHSENFGLVIAEALAAGVPALVTDTTPWSGLAAQDAGWCVPWARYGDTLAAALATDRATLAARGRRGRDCMVRDYSWERTARLLHEFYDDLSHERRRP
jgi:glycosyltransferase involved in cell wall biosynthesis